MEEGLEQYAIISLRGIELKVVPVGLVCPKLEILLLDFKFDSWMLRKVSDHFFVEMKALKVVSVSHGYVSLKSLQFSRSIRSLQLHKCKLRDISCIGTLSTLETVSFRGSRFEELPKEFGMLCKLRLLDLRECNQLKRISSNVIQRLSQLEELYIFRTRMNNSIVWEVEQKVEETSNANASLFELNSLSHLATLYLSIRDCWIPKDFIFPKLRSYKITVNPWFLYRHSAEHRSTTLRISDIVSTSLTAFKELYETLQIFALRNLPELSFIWKDCSSKHLSLHNLTDVEVRKCPRLRSCIFTVSLARSLVQLKVLRVSDCQNLRHIINIAEVEEEEDQFQEGFGFEFGNDIVLPKLQELVLYKLKNLVAFCPQNCNSTLPALSTLQVQDSSYLGPSFIAEDFVKKLRHVKVGDCHQVCDRILDGLKYGSKNLQNLEISNCGVKVVFQQLDGHELSFPSLKKLELKSLNELESLYMVPAHVLNLQNLSTLTLQSCHRLRHIFSTTLARNLFKLKDLTIEDCQQLEQIIVEDDDNEKEQNSLKDHLQSPCSSILSKIIVLGCNKLKSLFPVTISRNLLQLKKLLIKDCQELEHIIVEDDDEKDQTSLEDHLHSPCFSNLSYIRVEGCHKLKSLLHVTIAQNLLKLTRLHIEDCVELEQIFVGNDDVKECKEIMLRGFDYLSLQNLPSLINFCPVGYHFMFPSLTVLVLSNCPKITTSISVSQNRTVHVHAKTEAPQEDVSAHSPAESTREIRCLSTDDIQTTLPPYVKN